MKVPSCVCQPFEWNGRAGYRLGNRTIELVVLLGGGHLVDFRQSGSSVNVLWQATWPTIDPQFFSPEQHGSRFGAGPAARLLCGYTGHALALPYFGMPNDEQSARGLALHGEAATAEWTVVSHDESADAARLVLAVTLPDSRLELRRKIILRARAHSVQITETVSNLSGISANLQWVQHAAFGPPFFSAEDSTLHLAAERGKTWPLGYESTPLLQSDVEFSWPNASTIHNQTLDLSIPFQRPGTGFVACVLMDHREGYSAILIHNRRHALIAGYVFERERFPWVTLWEENCARQEPPWNGQARVRGVEFGNSPFPLGLAWAERARELFETPVFTTIAPGQSLQTTYHLFLSPVPESWEALTTVHASRDRISVGCNQDEVTLDLNSLPMPNQVLEAKFHSPALHREMPYLVVIPDGYDRGEQRYPVLYLLHGWNGDCRNWCTLTTLTEYASRHQFLIVTPEGQNSWYVNSATNAADRFYDYLSHDLISEIDARYRTVPSREMRAMAGLSMGGYGSFLVSLKHPELFCVVGSVSGAFNAPVGIEEVLPDVRPSIEAAYGEAQSLTRLENNVFSLLQDPPPGLPFYFVQCGTEDALLPANRLLIAELAAKRIPYEYHELAGDHTWEFWDAALPPLLELVQKFFGS